MCKMITAEITKNKDIILSTYGTFNKEKAEVIIALANEIAEDLGAPSANNILIDIANKVKYGDYQANMWEADKEQFKTCGKCGIKKSLYEYTDNCHYLDYKNKTCKDCLALDVTERGDSKREKVSKEIRTITDVIIDQTRIDEDLVTYARSARFSTFYPYRASPYKLLSLKNELLAKCQSVEFDYKQYAKNTGA